MATINNLPFEMLSITAADTGLTNRNRKQARLVCRKLAAVMTPVIFRRAYISRIKADRDAFLSLAATPHLAAHVEEIIWFELEIDFGSFKEADQVEVELSDGRSVNLFEATQDIFWLPIEPKFQRKQNGNGKIIFHDPPKCATEFLVQFKAAVARMPKLHTFASEHMAPHRITSLVDGFPFEVGLLTRYEYRDQTGRWSHFLRIFLETIAEEKGRVNKLHCGNELSGSLARIHSRYHAAMPYLISLEISFADVYATINGEIPNIGRTMCRLRNAIYKATELRELSLFADCTSDSMQAVEPLSPGALWALIQPPDKIHTWKHLRTFKLGFIRDREKLLLSLIEAHVTTLRHLQLDQCRPDKSFAVALSQLDGLQLESIIISDSEIPESGLVSEEELLRFIHREDAGDAKQAKKIAEGKFVTHNRRTDNIDKSFKIHEADADNISDHSSEWWSDTDSDFEPDIVSTG